MCGPQPGKKRVLKSDPILLPFTVEDSTQHENHIEDTVQLPKPSQKAGDDVTVIKNMVKYLLGASGPLMDQERVTPVLGEEAR